MPEKKTELIDVKELVKLGLKYVHDNEPGLTRKRQGKKFKYLKSGGGIITAVTTIQRIESLVIPPAWENVWICVSERGHLQATGRDARGRKQYRYHPDFRSHRDKGKFSRMQEFAAKLPGLRRHVDNDLKNSKLTKEKVLATVVRLLEKTLIRVGNKEYADQNHSYGLSTLEEKHVKASQGKLRLLFKGKSGVAHDVEITDPLVCEIVHECQDLPGQHLFHYRDARKKIRDINSSDVNNYIREIAETDFSAKDFRTWRGTVMAVAALEKIGKASSVTAARRNLVGVVKEVAGALRNRPATCRKYYIHPGVITTYEDGAFEALVGKARRSARKVRSAGLSVDEQTTVNFLKQLPDSVFTAPKIAKKIRKMTSLRRA